MNTLVLKPIPTDDDEIIASAEELRLDEGGIDLLVNGETELSASFAGLDPFELAFRVLPEDFELEEVKQDDRGYWYPEVERVYAADLPTEALEQVIWIHLTEYAARKGIKK